MRCFTQILCVRPGLPSPQIILDRNLSESLNLSPISLQQPSGWIPMVEQEDGAHLAKLAKCNSAFITLSVGTIMQRLLNDNAVSTQKR